jgi:Flp pilus assembly protein TadD
LGNVDQALADYDLAVQLVPTEAHPRFGRGIAKLRKGDRTGGEADIAAAIAMQPGIAAEYADFGIVP